MPITLAIFALLLQRPAPSLGAGELKIISGRGSGVLCALKGTKVDADLQGFGARVHLVQTFKNPSTEPVEAIYTFPLPNDAAVDRMRIEVGPRIIEGELRRRDEAQAIYNAAKNAGQTAALLDQERSNVFTQSIANLAPGAEVKVEISYVQIVRYEAGQFEFHLPMTVGPRYSGASTPDPQKISPPTLAPGVRSGATIDVRVALDAGAPIQSLTSVLHKIEVDRPDDRHALVRLTKQNEVPNRDFVLRYRVATDALQSAFLTHYEPERGGYFSLILLPPKAPAPAVVAPKEMVFVMDQSGSQDGFPIAKSKELTNKLIEKMGPRDTFNVMGFSNDLNLLWPAPRPNTEENRRIAEAFVMKMRADGGTELQRAVVAALTPKPDPRRLRYVVFNTDGFVGQDAEILAAVRKYRGATRMFVFGIGNGVNRDLIDSMAYEGRGDAEVVTLAEAADGAADRLAKKAGNPILTDIHVTMPEGSEITPGQIPDVLTDKPIVVFGRYAQPGKGHLEITGTMAGKPWRQSLTVDLPAANDDATAVMSLWAMRRVADFEREDYMAMTRDEGHERAKALALKVALAHGIMSRQTSFVAVEKRVVNVGGKQRTIRVPVEMTDGVDMEADQSLSYRRQPQGGFGGGARSQLSSAAPTLTAAPAKAKALANKGPEAPKIPAKLLHLKGSVTVQIRLKTLDETTLAKLKELGFEKLATIDDLKVVIGNVDAAKLLSIARLDSVLSIVADK